MTDKKTCFAKNGNVTFNNDIKPTFAPYRDPMMWRFDLTNYEAVKHNSKQILYYIRTKQMPPPPREPLSKCFVDNFKQWMDDGYPE